MAVTLTPVVLPGVDPGRDKHFRRLATVRSVDQLPLPYRPRSTTAYLNMAKWWWAASGKNASLLAPALSWGRSKGLALSRAREVHDLPQK